MTESITVNGAAPEPVSDAPNGTVLIANRGEIARRIIRSAKALGMRTVAVYSDADRAAPHVREADVAVRLGPAAPRESYLDIDRILAAAEETGATLIHPGYGFLSESVPFVRAVEAAGIGFVGPSTAQIEAFGEKHTARALAESAGVPLVPGSQLLGSLDEAVAEADRIGYPVMLKATGGGGGIGMQACADADQLRDAYEQVDRVARASFDSSGMFLERLVRPARHVEVQVFGDGAGRVAVIGDRDCSLQRRNQKIIEEAPAPDLPPAVREQLHASAVKLAAEVDYRSAGTVEFIYDPVRQEAYFLEVNTRLQVEHPVTEEVYDVDLVELMLRLGRDGADGVDPEVFTRTFEPSGFAVEARVYAEDPGKGGAPSPGLVTNAVFPGQGADPIPGVRVDGWVETGSEVSPFYDPMLAKVIASGPTRADALDTLRAGLQVSRVDGVVTNLGSLIGLTELDDFVAARHSTSTPAGLSDPDPRIDVVAPGLMTTVQDLPGRVGLWHVGVPPSGPFDPISLREANLLVGNPEGAPGLEITATGPTLTFSSSWVVAVTGAPVTVDLDGQPVPQWEPVEVPAGATLRIGVLEGPGMRSYLAVRGGFDVPLYLGSASTFTLGKFGGHAGRALVAGDVLRPGSPDSDAAHPAITDADARLGRVGTPTPAERRPAMTNAWQIGVTEGPHAAPEFFTREDIETFYATDYAVHHNSARTGVRLIGPHPQWARPDGGEAGLHPSNIHDTAYAVGAIDFTGDTPIILGPDGPSLGGFVCPAVVASGEMWKIGQVRPGDTIRFVPVGEKQARGLSASCASPTVTGPGDGDDGVLGRLDADDDHPSVTYRRDGDDNVLVEYGPMTLDLGLRMRVHALMTLLEQHAPAGVVEMTPGIRSLQVRTDPDVLLARDVAALLAELEPSIGATKDLTVPSRIVRLPLSWDDPATKLAIERYMAGVRADAPWTPSNIEFIRRVNGLEDVEDVRRIVYDASYFVLGLGDVYLGAPVATPLDPRHRLVTTKYNPARTWTAENSVGIGGAYLCVYGMEGPGGYQFVGRTVQVWNRFRRSGMFVDHPWSLRFFDRIEWYPVSADELLELRAENDAGRATFETVDGEFSLSEYQGFLAENHDSIEQFRQTQSEAFARERERWRESGEFDMHHEPPAPAGDTVTVPEGTIALTAPFTATVWQVSATPGDTLAAGDRVLALEAMKMETPLTVSEAGTVVEIYVQLGDQVAPGQVLAAVRPQ